LPRLLVFITFAFPVICLRLAALWADPIAPGLADFRGLVALLAVISGVCGLVVWACQKYRWVLWPAAFFWTGIHLANHEYLSAVGAALNLSYWHYLSDGVFVGGSALSPAHPILLLLVLAATMGLAGAAWRKKLDGAGFFGWLALLTLVVFFVLPRSNQRASWRQSHFLLQNVGWKLSPAFGEEDGRPVPSTVPGVFPGDLNGKKRIGSVKGPVNVLLIILEAIPGSALPSLAKSQNVEPHLKMHGLDRLSRDNLILRSFFNQQRQTNRGEYAILCGDLPRLVTRTPKMSEVAASEYAPPYCLPQALRERGYHTAYLQAAPLVFMEKGRFMRRIGFDEVLGTKSLPRAYHRTKWGIDDRAFFEQAVEKIDVLRQGSNPWFLTLLTVGTHHPYALPPGRAATDDPNAGLVEAVAYLDQVFQQFLDMAGRDGLENTLVLITSDESNETQHLLGPGDDQGLLSQAWGFLVAKAPGIKAGEVHEPFMQMDIPLSVVDYLGYENLKTRFGGRSFFRSYAEPRPVFFANTYMKMVGAIDPKGAFVACDESLTRCRTRPGMPNQPFVVRLSSKEGEAAPKVAPAPGFLQDAVARSLLSVRGTTPWKSHTLVEKGSTELGPRSWLTLYSGQGFHVPANAVLEQELELEVRGTQGVRVMHLVKPIGNWDFELSPGSRHRLHFTLGTQDAISGFDPVLGVAQVAGNAGEALLHVHKAQVRIRAMKEGEKPGVTFLEATHPPSRPAPNPD
jgi:hypothetical protein